MTPATKRRLKRQAKGVVEFVLMTVESATRRKIVFPAGYVSRDSGVITPVTTVMIQTVEGVLKDVYERGRRR